MKKITLTFILCLSVIGPSFAQNDLEAMKFLTINAMMQYGQKLYDRGDYSEATAVFNHVLTYDGHQIQALQYLKDMGHSPVVEKFNAPAINTVDVLNTQSLQEAIKAKKQIIEKLQAQITQMRANMASQSKDE